ncbi:reverse transcriptase domain-containing protein [Tanacetum coccineum]
MIQYLSPKDITNEGYNLQNRVANLVTHRGWSWPQTWLRKAPNLGQLLVPILDEAHLDTPQWRDVNGKFSNFLVKCAWDALRPRGTEVPWYQIMWFSHCILRHAFHLWLVMRNSLKTQDRLRKWDIGVNSDVNLLRCMEDVSQSFHDIISYSQPMAHRRTAKSIIGRILVAVAAYFIWVERNNRLFKNVRRSPEEIRDIIMVTVRLKLLTFRFKNKAMLGALVCDMSHSSSGISSLELEVNVIAERLGIRCKSKSVIKYRNISTIAPVISYAAPVVETTLVASPTGLCGLVPYSGSDSDSPDEMSSPEHISPLLAISPLLCIDSSKAPDSSDGPPSQDPYVATVARWRSRVTPRPSSSSEFPIAPVTALPGIHRWSAILIQPGEAILFGRSYRTHLNGPLHSSGLDAPNQAHSGSSARDVPPRLCYPPRRAPRHREAFRRWCAALLSTLYPPTTSESSSGDSSERPLHSSSPSIGPSCKRCRSPVDSVPSSTPFMGSLAPTRVDLLPPRKRFRDLYSSEASIEEDTEIDPIETKVDIELGIGDRDDVRDHVAIDPMSAPIVEEEIVEPAGEDSSDSSGTRDGIVRSFEDMPIDLNDVRRLEADPLIARGHRVGMIERIKSLRLENLKEEFHQIRKDRDDTPGRLRRLESYVERRIGLIHQDSIDTGTGA